MLLGLLHLAFTYLGDKLHPRDADLLERLKTTSPVITRQTILSPLSSASVALSAADDEIYNAVTIRLNDVPRDASRFEKTVLVY